MRARSWILTASSVVVCAACQSSSPPTERPSGQGGNGGQASGAAGASGVSGSSGTSAGAAAAGAAGAAGTAGAKKGGTGGELPSIEVTVAWPPIVRTKVDLLFMIDNSSSMADKQAIFAEAVPALVERFVSPACRKDDGTVVARLPSGDCPAGMTAEFQPPTDMHIGIIDSSLGSYGVSGICDDSQDSSTGEAHNDDKAHLITRGAKTVPSEGFLGWAAGADVSKLGSTFASMVAGVGEHGCGYEAQLESIYRFLIDPDPPARFAPITDLRTATISPTGTDAALLEQRAAFLRPDSVVLVVLFSDEDDCSLRQDGQAWLAIAPMNGTSGTSLLRSGTTACKTNPNDPCCVNCGMTSVPAGCVSPSEDPACTADGGVRLVPIKDDPYNLRCWRQKQRYGVDFLYPVQRYIDGFSKATIANRAGDSVPNPLFHDLSCQGDDCAVVRDPGSVLFTAVVGVPWQDLARNPRDIGKGYRSAKELVDDSIWPIVLGDPTASPPKPPTDPLMIDSVEPRTATTTGNPLGDEALPAGIDSPADKNPVNGHEWDTARTPQQANSDLQYACIFDLPETKDCSKRTVDCDCIDGSASSADAGVDAAGGNGSSGGAAAGSGGPSQYKSPLCQQSDGKYGTEQRRAKAYPGLRHLQVVQGLKTQALAASICPAHLDIDRTDPTYGYNPVIDLIVEITAPHLPPAAK